MTKRKVDQVLLTYAVIVYYDSDYHEYTAEFRDAPKDRREATAYHTDDKRDALETAMIMARQGWG
ncbi:hypothetical protein VJI72_07795 [Parvimonas micra]|uniref:hypothetical protein n=1 Tax=Parvimonas TaxID=543311 RepID=UPI002B4772DC|nr:MULTISPECIES: hypothetical protein [Parvimonas]MEB3025864.1 hypothetical protein [Parvimonas sp. M13]MEB3029683.1 hypothetical protein [Parvimonas micra]MEB3059359.1 hypothetical protein [Parvimonas sp. D9]MEB3067287.1 hypothetical protein [Parvimonas micra]MEB3089986.1 hypothetical protein [Parvimonas sp. M20]